MESSRAYRLWHAMLQASPPHCPPQHVQASINTMVVHLGTYLARLLAAPGQGKLYRFHVAIHKWQTQCYGLGD